MKYLKLAMFFVVSSIGVAYLSSVYNEFLAFGLMTISPDGEPVGVLNGNYPSCFYIGMGASVGAIGYTVFLSIQIIRSNLKSTTK